MNKTLVLNTLNILTEEDEPTSTNDDLNNDKNRFSLGMSQRQPSPLSLNLSSVNEIFSNLQYCDEAIATSLSINMDSEKRLEYLEQLLIDRLTLTKHDENNKELSLNHLNLDDECVSKLSFQSLLQNSGENDEKQNFIDNSKNIEKIELKYNRLRSVPINFLKSEHFANLHIIDLSHNQLTSVNMETIAGGSVFTDTVLTNVREINLSNNSIKNISDNSKITKVSTENQYHLKKQNEHPVFSSLERLHLANNGLTNSLTNSSVLTKFQNLKYLNLSDNNFQLTQSAFDLNNALLEPLPWQFNENHLKNLTELNLTRNNKPVAEGQNKKKTTNNNLISDTQTNQLLLSNSSNKMFNRLTNLRILNLSENNLNNIPPDIHELKMLEELYLDGNQISFIPIELTDLRNLKCLSFNQNCIDQLNVNFFKYARFKDSLTKFEISKNLLSNESIPEHIALFHSLKKFDLSGNRLEQIPNVLPVRLEELNLRSNKIKTLMIRPLSKLIKQNDDLKKAIMPNNGGNHQNYDDDADADDVNEADKFIMPHVFYLRRLRILDLSDNHIQEIPDDFGILNSSLESLNMSNNLLTKFNTSLCRGLGNLKSLNLSLNRIRSIPDKIRELADLNFLDLSSNRIVILL
jgi:leucine-rich repeat protein SHOC2